MKSTQFVFISKRCTIFRRKLDFSPSINQQNSASTNSAPDYSNEFTTIRRISSTNHKTNPINIKPNTVYDSPTNTTYQVRAYYVILHKNNNIPKETKPIKLEFPRLSPIFDRRIFLSVFSFETELIRFPHSFLSK